jgi:MoxR-like ATPase
VIIGKPEVVRVALVTLFAEGHLLVEDVPGVGKTSLAKALARSIDGSVSRVQFTPDLMPVDITGLSIFNRQSAEFEFRPGPVFANVVIADEINRASPKTQSALLECMAEHQVTVDGATYALASPFMVVATQNPVEMDGTYPLPEPSATASPARVSVGYPDLAAELAMIDEHAAARPVRRAAPGHRRPPRPRGHRDRAPRAHRPRGAPVLRRDRRRDAAAAGAAPRRVAAGHPAAGAHGARAGRARRARLRGARRRAGRRGAGARPPAPAHPDALASPPLPRRHRARSWWRAPRCPPPPVPAG